MRFGEKNHFSSHLFLRQIFTFGLLGMQLRFFLFIFILGIISHTVRSQEVNKQLWLEYKAEYPFANSWLLENAVTYSEVLGSSAWAAFDYAPSLEYSLTQNIDLVTGVTLCYTIQTDDYNTLEIRPMIGTRIHFTPNRRVLLRTYIRLEQRNFKNLETKEWDKTFRPRWRLECIVPLNRKTYFENKLWYILTDAEWFMTVDEDVDERFANRFRMRAGLGYRLSYNFRFEFIFMHQQSRNKLEDNFATSDNIFRLRVKHYFRKTKPVQNAGGDS